MLVSKRLHLFSIKGVGSQNSLSSQESVQPCKKSGQPLSAQRRKTIHQNEDCDEDNLQFFARVTRSGNPLQRFADRIKKLLEDSDEVVSAETVTCIICYEKKKSALLLPCRHQHTCDACWTLWTIECQKTQDISFNEDDDDEDDKTKPRCPYCKAPVDNVILALN